MDEDDRELIPVSPDGLEALEAAAVARGLMRSRPLDDEANLLGQDPELLQRAVNFVLEGEPASNGAVCRLTCLLASLVYELGRFDQTMTNDRCRATIDLLAGDGSRL